ncbi:MAG: acylphosphatase [Bdellovibrionota bacterium]
MFEAVVKGKVQGVSYRYWAQQRASSLHVKGWIQNQLDGSVKIRAVGTKENLEMFLQWCGEGSPSATVESVEASWNQTEERYDDFRIRA